MAVFAPKYRPVRTENLPFVGRVDVYEGRMIDAGITSAQAAWIRNNAKPNMKSQYAIKTFPTLAEAFAAYQRQKEAARLGAAPPVRRMVKHIIPAGEGVECACGCGSVRDADEVVRWGYQTCVATRVGISGSVDWDYERYYRNRNRRKGGGKGLPRVPKWIGTERIHKMMQKLERVSIIGMQKDFSKMGVVFRRNIPLIHDLHAYNIGTWQDKAVVIDFGYHIVQQD